MKNLSEEDQNKLNKLLNMNEKDIDNFIHNGDYCAYDIYLLWEYIKEQKEAIRSLLDFIADKYKDVVNINDFTCEHHRKLATLISWEKKHE